MSAARTDTAAISRAVRSDAAEKLSIVGRSVRLSHPDRVVWPLTGTTKRDLVDYLLGVAPVLLPHLRSRATMLWRLPEGVDGPGWFQAQCRSRPDWVDTIPVVGRRGDPLEYCRIEEPATLAWLANLGTIELHPHGWRVGAPDRPTSLVVDLDPGPPATLVEAARVALLVRERLTGGGLDPVVKTSGSLGLHVAAALSGEPSFASAKGFVRGLAEALADEHPALVVAVSDRAARSGRVYVDWIQNDGSRQLIAPYSPRAVAIPQVSTPLTWDEVEAAAAGVMTPLRPGFAEVRARVDRLGDPCARSRPAPLPG